jgi:hypothetical protein
MKRELLKQRFEGPSLELCGGRLTTWWTDNPSTDNEDDAQELHTPFHIVNVEFVYNRHAHQVTSIRETIDTLAMHSCTLMNVASQDPEALARVLRFLIFREHGVLVIGHPSIHQEMLENNFELQTHEHVPRVIDRELRFAARLAPVTLGSDGLPRPPPLGLMRVDPTTWRVMAVTVDLVSGDVIQTEIPKRTMPEKT